MNQPTQNQFPAVSEAAAKRIRGILASIEQEHNVTILCAVESGSRCWGMAGADSDYDVRFVYARRTPCYLCVNPDAGKDVLEWGIHATEAGVIDCNGWDLRKSLRLFAGSNAGLLEWFRSPVVYLNRFGFLERMRALIDEHFSLLALWHHYYALSRKSLERYEKTGIAKAFLYALRTQLMLLWIEQRRTTPPVVFAELAVGLLPPALSEEALAFLARRTSMQEASAVPVPESLQSFLKDCARKTPPADLTPPASRPSLDPLFRELLQQCDG